MASEKFQFRNKTYHVDKVVDTVMDKVSDPGFKSWCTGLIEKSVSNIKEPDWNDKKVIAFGRDNFEREWNRKKVAARKAAVTACINKAFNEVIDGGATNNPYAPETVDEIDREIIEKTLTRIRNIRKGTVQRAYSRR